MWKKSFIKIFLTVILVFVFSQSAHAFSDIEGNIAKKEILYLKERDIINGFNENIFAPNKDLTYAAGVSLVVKAFDLNIDHIRFIKEPKASDFYTNIPDEKWYSTAFINAFHNGISLPKDIKPNEIMTKEQFADLLFKAMTSKEDIPFIQLWVMINDEADISPEYMNSIQKMIISKIEKLDKDKNYNPKKLLSRSDAAMMLYNTILFFEEYTNGIVENKDVTIDITPLTENVNQIIVSWGEKTYGHTIKVNKVEFTTEQEAVIYFQLGYPNPNKSYPQVMTYPKDIVYLSSQYTPILKLENSEEYTLN